MSKKIHDMILNIKKTYEHIIIQKNKKESKIRT